ncbi:MAG: TrmB family transcriptional regulator [Candidatus Thorarchaeota archaeon]|nr:TrmB family transcriptional regulator [Candidatus Thorarchaeota archaeon]
MSLVSEKKLGLVTNRAMNVLRDLGFGAHEASVIIALNQVASATVADLHTTTGIHHANLYAVLDGLTARGFVVSHEGRPKVYQFAPLSHLEDTLHSKLNQLIEDLSVLQEERSTDGAMPALIYTIRGRLEVMSKMHGMIHKANERILLVCPNLSLLGEEAIESLKDAAERGVTIRAILGSPSDLEGIKLKQRIKEEALAINLVMDGVEALISMPDFSVCGWADNELIALQFEGFLEQTWNLARTI